jgi:hypothetical protein
MASLHPTSGVSNLERQGGSGEVGGITVRFSSLFAAVVLLAIVVRVCPLDAASDRGQKADGSGCTAERVERLKGAAMRGSTAAQAELGSLLAEGRCVDLDAKFSLGMIYLQGGGVSPDMRVAVTLLMEAAQGGHARAQYAVGSLYASGRGFVKDRIQAYKWINLSMRGEEEHTRAVLATLAKGMTAEEITAAEREVAEWRRAH